MTIVTGTVTQASAAGEMPHQAEGARERRRGDAAQSGGSAATAATAASHRLQGASRRATARPASSATAATAVSHRLSGASRRAIARPASSAGQYRLQFLAAALGQVRQQPG